MESPKNKANLFASVCRIRQQMPQSEYDITQPAYLPRRNDEKSNKHEFALIDVPLKKAGTF